MSPPATHPRPDVGVRDALFTQLEDFERDTHRRDAHRLDLLSQLFHTTTSTDGRVDDLEYRSLRLEVATTLRQSEHTAERLLDLAWATTQHYPRARSALHSGEVSLAHVRVIVDAGHTLTTGHPDTDDAKRAAYEEDVLPFAAEETPNRLRPIAQRLAAVHAGDDLTEQHEQAVARRRVWVQDADHGMADLYAHLPAEEAYAIKDRLTRIAAEVTVAEHATATADTAATGGTGVAGDAEGTGAGLKGADGAGGAEAFEASTESARSRTRDEVRADVFCDLLLERPGTTQDIACRVRAQVQLVVPGEAIGLASAGKMPDTGGTSGTGRGSDTGGTGLTDSAGGTGGVAELIGHGPIDPHTAARIAGTADVWERVTVNKAGDVLAVDRYRPTPQMRRLLAARDLHCRAPGCRTPATRCDIDHTIDAATGGPTRTDNLAHLCRGHHTVKHHTNWTVTQEPGGVMRWTSPTGRETVDRPPSRVRFRPVALKEHAA